MCTCLIGCQVQTITKPMPPIGKKRRKWNTNCRLEKEHARFQKIQLLEVIDITDCDILLHTTSCLRFVLPYKAGQRKNGTPPLYDVLSFEKTQKK